MTTLDTAKQAAARAAVDDHINSNIRIVGIGSGTTIIPALDRIAEMVKRDKLDLICVPTSFQVRTPSQK
ncbi:unnamed protein product [Rotaria sordida]|uniref:ribose-5-phosphate isomerase n=1 Tax=Rotaria sordida TaxID=392033 RepID=A0A815TV06_9BILA|nr:unnamed protein product [Rotaria sordida]